MTKILSWNLLRLTGATCDEVAALIRRERPDLLVMQEATEAIDRLAEEVGGYYHRSLLPGRIHGLAAWSPTPFASAPRVLRLQPGAMFERVCLILSLGAFAVANVHLSHGQVLNRRQLRRIAEALPPRAAVLGDYNLLGPAMLPGFRDVGPREPTPRSLDLVPVGIDGCLVRGMACLGARALGRGGSDHRPIAVYLLPTKLYRSPAVRLRLRTVKLRRVAAQQFRQRGLKLRFQREPAQDPGQDAARRRAVRLVAEHARSPTNPVGPGET